jgi:hypothetical protein
MKRVLICLAALPLLASGASAAGRLSDPQLDVVTAGETPGHSRRAERRVIDTDARKPYRGYHQRAALTANATLAAVH